MQSQTGIDGPKLYSLEPHLAKSYKVKVKSAYEQSGPSGWSLTQFP